MNIGGEHIAPLVARVVADAQKVVVGIDDGDVLLLYFCCDFAVVFPTDTHAHLQNSRFGRAGDGQLGGFGLDFEQNLAERQWAGYVDLCVFACVECLDVV